MKCNKIMSTDSRVFSVGHFWALGLLAVVLGEQLAGHPPGVQPGTRRPVLAGHPASTGTRRPVLCRAPVQCLPGTRRPECLPGTRRPKCLPGTRRRVLAGHPASSACRAPGVERLPGTRPVLGVQHFNLALFAICANIVCRLLFATGTSRFFWVFRRYVVQPAGGIVTRGACFFCISVAASICADADGCKRFTARHLCFATTPFLRRQQCIGMVRKITSLLPKSR